MQILSLIKKEYFDTTIIFDVNDLNYMVIKSDYTEFKFKNSGNDVLCIIKSDSDTNDSLKRISLDIYSSWKKYVDNMHMIQQVMTEE